MVKRLMDLAHTNDHVALSGTNTLTFRVIQSTLLLWFGIGRGCVEEMKLDLRLKTTEFPEACECGRTLKRCQALLPKSYSWPLLGDGIGWKLEVR